MFLLRHFLTHDRMRVPPYMMHSWYVTTIAGDYRSFFFVRRQTKSGGTFDHRGRESAWF